VRGEVDGGHHLGRDVCPLLVSEGAVGGMVADGGVPHRFLGWVLASVDRLLQQPGQRTEIESARRRRTGFQRGELAGAAPRGNKVRVAVFLAFAWPEEIAE